MKKILFAVLVFATLAIGSVFAEAQMETGDEDFVLGLSISTLNNPFFVTLEEGAQNAAKEQGVILVVFDSEDDPAREASNIDDLILMEVDALLINPTDGEAVVPSIMKANAKGIPVFTIDRGSSGGEVIAHIASDNVAGGKMAAQFLVEQIGGSGSVVELEGIAGTSAARDRGEGFNSVIAGYPEVYVVAKQTANFNRAEGLTVFENILQAQPEIDAVFAHNDEMILGAIQAAEAAGRADDILFVGFDAVDDAVAAVKAGRLAATVAQIPSVIGNTGVEMAIKYLNGETVESFISVSLKLVVE